jgi:hypothetical protein
MMSCSFIRNSNYFDKQRIRISLFNYNIYTNSTINVCISQISQTFQSEYSLLVHINVIDLYKNYTTYNCNTPHVFILYD